MSKWTVIWYSERDSELLTLGQLGYVSTRTKPNKVGSRIDQVRRPGKNDSTLLPCSPDFKSPLHRFPVLRCTHLYILYVDGVGGS